MFGLSLKHQLIVSEHWISSKPHVSDGQTMWLNVNAVSIWLINFKRINVGHRIVNSKRIKRWTPLRWIKCFFIHRMFIYWCTSSKVVFVTCENGKWNSPFCCQVARDQISWFGTFSRYYSVCTAIFFCSTLCFIVWNSIELLKVKWFFYTPLFEYVIVFNIW